jgi:tRNA threonylcarbamoyladenosine biosynthesis protein TsaE
VILAAGELGAGKTCLANGIAAGLGIEGPTPSPTFTLLRSYAGTRGIKFHHLDFYRLNSDDEAETIGLDDCFGEDSVVYIEWPDRCPHAVEGWTLRRELEAAGETARRVRATGRG